MQPTGICYAPISHATPQLATLGLHPIVHVTNYMDLLIYRPPRDGWLSWPCWLTDRDVWPTKWSSVQLAVWCRIGKVRRPRPAFYPLCYAANRKSVVLESYPPTLQPKKVNNRHLALLLQKKFWWSIDLLLHCTCRGVLEGFLIPVPSHSHVAIPSHIPIPRIIDFHSLSIPKSDSQ